MSLPILNITTQPTPQTLLRLFHQTERDFVRHLSEETAMDFGTAFHNSKLSNVNDANCILDGDLPDGMNPADVLQQARGHYERVGSVLRSWVMNPSSSRTQPLAQHLIADGFASKTADVLHLSSAPPAPVREVGGLKIIPTRASFRHARQLAEEGAKRWNQPQLADAAMMHLDDPHWDSLLALRDGVAVAHIAVLAVGEIGRIDDVFVSEKYRRLGIGRTMMSRALEICARSLFKHVMLCTGRDNLAAQALYASLGFQKIGTITAYQRTLETADECR